MLAKLNLACLASRQALLAGSQQFALLCHYFFKGSKHLWLLLTFRISNISLFSPQLSSQTVSLVKGGKDVPHARWLIFPGICVCL